MEHALPAFENKAYLESELARCAEHTYADLPYHNFAHALHTWEVAENLADYCEANELSADRRIIMASALFHDAGFEVPLAEHGLHSKEEYSAYIAGQVLPDFSFSTEELVHVQDCIRSTERGIPCQSLEAKIIRRADLDNLTGNIPSLLQNSWKLWVEADQLSEGSLPLQFNDWICGIRSNLQAYFDEDVSFGEFDKVGGQSIFLAAALRNIEKIDLIAKAMNDGLIQKSWQALMQLKESTLDQLIAKAFKRSE